MGRSAMQAVGGRSGLAGTVLFIASLALMLNTFILWARAVPHGRRTVWDMPWAKIVTDANGDRQYVEAAPNDDCRVQLTLDAAVPLRHPATRLHPMTYVQVLSLNSTCPMAPEDQIPPALVAFCEPEIETMIGWGYPIDRKRMPLGRHVFVHWPGVRKNMPIFSSAAFGLLCFVGSWHVDRWNSIRTRRRRHGLCTACGYPMVGVETCPECGADCETG